MEATLEREKPKFTLGNKVPNSFEELNAMTKNRYANVNTETGTNDATLRFARSMNLPKFTSTVKKPCPEVEKEKYEIPESEYIWNPPYLKKTQIFPSYVRKNIFKIFNNIGNCSRLSNFTNEKRFYKKIKRKKL